MLYFYLSIILHSVHILTFHIYLFIYASIFQLYRLICISLFLSFLSINVSYYLVIKLFTYPYINLYLYRSNYLSSNIYLYIFPSSILSLSIYPYIHLHISHIIISFRLLSHISFNVIY